MINRRNFLNRTAGTAVVASAIYGVERAAAAEPSSRSPALAADRSNAVPPSVHADLKRHGTIFERKIHQVGGHVYSAVGFADGNSVMVVGDDGVIIVDSGPDLAAAREVAAEFRKITDKPVRAVIYTAFHVDHINGVKAFASTDDVEAGRVAIIAHETLLANVIRSTGTIGPILACARHTISARRLMAPISTE